MFDIGWSEILVIAVVAIVVVGPKDLPPMLRATGRMVSKLRKTAGEFQSQFNEALREAELDGVKDSINELRNLNPASQIRKSLDPIATALSVPNPLAKPAPAPVPPPSGQLALPMTDADIVPAASPLTVDRIAEAVSKPQPRKRKAKIVDVTEAAAETAEPAPAKRAPRARKPTQALVSEGASAIVKPSRATRAKPPHAPLPEPEAPVVTAAVMAPTVPAPLPVSAPVADSPLATPPAVAAAEPVPAPEERNS